MLLLVPLAAAPMPPLCVAVVFEAAGVELGQFGLWRSETDPIEPARAHETPPGYVPIGPFTDAGALPFRTWTDLAFTRLPLKAMSGPVGVGFTVQAWLRPDLSYEGVGANGAMRFEGTLEVSNGRRVLETVPVSWGRGFEQRPEGASEHAHSVQDSTPLHVTGRQGPYAWTLHGTLHSDVHLWSR